MFFISTEFSKDRESVECAKDNTTNARETSSATGGNSGNTGERTKRARRARPDVSLTSSNLYFAFILYV